MTVSRAGAPLLTTSMMTPMERAAGRFMRAPDHPGEQAPAGAGDNAPVIPPAGAAADSGADNAGQKLDPEAFWKAGQETPVDTAADDAKALGTQLTTSLQTMTFGEPVINETIANELAEGKFDNFNSRLVESQRQAVKQSMGLALTVMKAVESQIMRNAQAKIDAAFGSKESEADIFGAIPSAKNPAIRPQVQRIYDQALVNTKGDKKAALEMTKTMAKMLAESLAPDVGLNFSAGDPSGTAPAVNWMDELMGR